MKIEKDKMYTKKECADMLGVCEMTIARYIKKGLLSSYKRGTGMSARVRIKGEDFMKFMLDCRR